MIKQSFAKPFLIKQSAKHVQIPFSPYKSDNYYLFISQFWFTQPWIVYQHFLNSWFGMQQKLFEGSSEWSAWEQSALQQSTIEFTKWLTHVHHLSSEPYTLFRYLRMNWQKPFIEYNTEVVTSARLISHMWIEGLSAWAKGWEGNIKK